MKIRFWDRALLFLCALAMLLAGAYLIAQGAFLLSSAEQPMESAHIMLWAQAGAGVLLVLLSAYLFAFPCKLFSRRHDFVIQQTENGELRISVKAIENLVQKCIDLHPEIHVVSMRVRNSRQGVVIDLRIALANNISIPLAVASLQKQIRQYLSASSGIDVKEILVSVETAEDAAAEESPYLVSSPQTVHPAPEKAAESRDKEKPALHRRIFGRGEQAATVPEAPAAEPEAETAPEPEEPESVPEAMPDANPDGDPLKEEDEKHEQ